MKSKRIVQENILRIMLTDPFAFDLLKEHIEKNKDEDIYVATETNKEILLKDYICKDIAQQLRI